MKTVLSIDMNSKRQIIKKFSNDNGSDKENVTSKLAFTELWLFYDYPILFLFHNQNVKTKLVLTAAVFLVSELKKRCYKNWTKTGKKKFRKKTTVI